MRGKSGPEHVWGTSDEKVVKVEKPHGAVKQCPAKFLPEEIIIINNCSTSVVKATRESVMLVEMES